MASAMQTSNRLQQVLRSGTTAFGAWQMLPGHSLSRTLSRLGLDFITIDCEHGDIDDAHMHQSVHAIASSNKTSPIVRIPAAEPWLIKRALDSGAHGIMVPLVSTPADALAIVSAAKFPPTGTRGFGSPFPLPAFDITSTSEYLTQANGALLTIVQIETSTGLSNAAEIAAVDGIDVLFVGPYDLGNSIGCPITSADGTPGGQLADAIESIRSAAAGKGKKSGIYCVSGEQAGFYKGRGFDMVSVGGDMIALGAHLGDALSKAKGDTKGGEGGGPYGR